MPSAEAAADDAWSPNAASLGDYNSNTKWLICEFINGEGFHSNSSRMMMKEVNVEDDYGSQ